MTEIIRCKKLLIDGLYYIDDIKEDMSELIEKLDKLKWVNLTSSPVSRMVQHYGYKYNYTTYKIDEKCEDLPDFLIKYRDTLTDICKQLKIIDDQYIFNQCIINNYNEGQGISAHIDVKTFRNVPN
jgi:alkylated DNA repair dioxygenase AlkB